MEDENELHGIALNYYWDLYSKEAGDNFDSTKWKFPVIKRNCIWRLNRQVSKHEIKMAVEQMSLNKAPGDDGILAVLFRKYWHWVGSSVIEFICKVFQEGVVPERMNQSEHLEFISQF